MTGNDMGGTAPWMPSGALDLDELPEEMRHRRRPDKLLITGGVFGPQLIAFRSPDELPDEEDPNP